MNTSLAHKKLQKLDAIRFLLANSYTGIFMTLIAAHLIVYAFYNERSTEFKFWWLITITITLVLRLIDAIVWNKSDQESFTIVNKALTRHLLGIYTSAFLWSLYALNTVYYAGTIELASTIMIISGMAGGGATVLSAHKTTAIMYSIILLIPGSTLLLFTSGEHHYIFAILGFSFALVMAISAYKSAKFTTHAIELKNQNIALLNTMEEIVERRTIKIYELSNRDPLTNLLNRSAFLKKIDIQLAQKPNSHAVLFIDLDDFKHVNDSMGHKVGDQLLTQLAQRLLTDNIDDQLVCRWGGDEFLISLPNVCEEVAVDLAHDIIKCISKPYTFNNNTFSVSATIGIAMFPQHASDSQSLIQLADSAMYHQKDLEPSQVEMFSTKLHDQLERKNKLKNRLAIAIANNEFHLEYQPIVHADTNKIYSCEALLRWTLDGESISPVEFIPLAEQYGYIIDIGNWVLEQACLQASQWPTLDIISVNVSVIQLYDEQFINVVEKALSHNNFPAEKLNIEITESVFSEDMTVILERIRSLKNRGIKVSIDDFGTGYSSLSVIQDFKVNIIKIDRTFVSQLDANGFVIISAVIHIASSLNYKIVAEGVEDKEQADKLKSMGVDYLQGFLFSKPLNAESFQQYISNN